MKDLVRRHTAAELILTDTTERAIDAIEQRVPDLVLIPALMSPEDDEALTTALRVTEDAKHVQTLTIPLLGAPQSSMSLPQGVLSRLRGQQARPAAPDSCDPKLFAEQITEYLQRVAKDRSHLPSGNGNGKSAGQDTHGASQTATQTSTHGSSQSGSHGGAHAASHGNTQSGSHASAPGGGQSHGSRKVKAAAAHPPAQKSNAPAERSQPTAEPPRLVAPAPSPSPMQTAPPNPPAPRVQAASPPPQPVHAPPPAEPIASEPDVSALEAALSQVSFDEPEPESPSAPAPVETAEARAEAEALEKGLSSLLDRLSDMDWSDEPATTQPVKAAPPPVAPPKVAPPVAPPVAPHPAAQKVTGPSTLPDPAQWAELKQLESIEYAMPKIIPQDAPPPAAEAPKPEPPKPEAHQSAPSQPEPSAPQATAPKPPAPPPPAVASQPAAKPAASEWGDLLDSLKKDLGK